jgi:ketosteroid isomerase-like protein
MGGEEQRIASPSTIVFHREGDDWRIAVFHSAPLPQQPPEDY